MISKENLLNLTAMATGATLNRYHLDIQDCSAALDVEDFTGQEGLSTLYRYTIRFTSNEHDIQPQQMLRKSATFTLGTLPEKVLGSWQPPATVKTVHGVVTSFQRLSASADQVLYEIILQPFIHLLDRQFRSHRFFLNKSVPEVVTQILDEHGLKGWEYEFRLKASYPRREQINQYQESDLAFIQRLLAEVGIFYYFSLQPDTLTEVIHFADAQSAWEFGKTLPLNSPSGMTDSGKDSIWGLQAKHDVVQASAATKDYNHKMAHLRLESASADMTRGEGEGITYGEVSRWQPRHLKVGDKVIPEAESANFYARLDHERYLSTQTIISGFSNDATLRAGQVLTVSDANVPTVLPLLLQQRIVTLNLKYTASRRNALKVEIQATAYSETRCWRPSLKPRPKVIGTMVARVTSAKANDLYAWQDASGLYRVKFDADLDDRQPGLESMPVRLAKPYGGDLYGFHFPLIQGTEVAIAFHEGDPDRPYIAHALHDSRHPDHVTERNSSRNVIRTPANNKFRMEDKRGEEHIKLSTEYGGKSQLNLGHIVDASRGQRGEGAELRTDDWLAVRGGKGVFISADKQQTGSGQMLAMDNAFSLVEGGVNQIKDWGEISQSHHNLEPDARSLEEYLQNIDRLCKPAMVLSAPAGIGAVTPETLLLRSGKTLYAQSRGEIQLASAKRIAINARQTLSLLSQSDGMRLISGNGPLEMESHGDTLSVNALKDIAIQSTQGHLQLTAKNGITLACGGAYIRLTAEGQIEIHGPGMLSLKGIHVLDAPEGKVFPLPALPQSVCKECLQKAQQEAVGFVPRG